LIAWECTTILLGEFGPRDIESNPLFSVIDSLIMMTQELVGGEQRRYLQAVKVRGASHSLDKHPFVINATGIEIFAPKVTIRGKRETAAMVKPSRHKTGVASLDSLIEQGLETGSSTLIAGPAGTGKTMLLLEFLYRGARDYGERGLFVSCDETEARLRTLAANLGWDLDAEINSGRIEFLVTPYHEVMIDEKLMRLQERLEQGKFQRLALDSLSGLLSRVHCEETARERCFQLKTVVDNAQAIALMTTQAQPGSERIGRFGVEESVMDGVILLSSVLEHNKRQRFIEVYKMRNTFHLAGRFPLSIGRDGLHVEVVRGQS
jgi:circadian clock protein KaiC